MELPEEVGLSMGEGLALPGEGEPPSKKGTGITADSTILGAYVKLRLHTLSFKKQCQRVISLFLRLNINLILILRTKRERI